MQKIDFINLTSFIDIRKLCLNLLGEQNQFFEIGKHTQKSGNISNEKSI